MGYQNETRYPCDPKCPFAGADGCNYYSVRNPNSEPVPRPEDGICPFPRAHENSVGSYRLNLGNPSSSRRKQN